MSRALELRALDAGYDGVPVVRGLDLHVDTGEVVALLGANGAGKTTVLRTIAGLVPGLAGSLRVLGDDVDRRRRGGARRTLRLARRGVSLVPEDRALFASLTVMENLRLGARRGDRDAIDAALESFPALARLTRRRAGLLSGGEQQMLALARALATRPRVLLLDEMSLGLAPIVVEQLLPTVRGAAAAHDVGVLLVEQQVPAALAVADRAYVLRRGRVVAEGPADDLAGRREVLEAGYLGDVSTP